PLMSQLQEQQRRPAFRQQGSRQPKGKPERRAAIPLLVGKHLLQNPRRRDEWHVVWRTSAQKRCPFGQHRPSLERGDLVPQFRQLSDVPHGEKRPVCPLRKTRTKREHQIGIESQAGLDRSLTSRVICARQPHLFAAPGPMPFRPIHVALNFTDSYWALAYTVMRSICLSSQLRREIGFHLIHGALRPDHAATLETITAEFGARLTHYDPAENSDFRAVIDHLPATARFPAIVYGRLLLDRLLPTEVERVIYLDCDIMVRRPIEELFDIDLAGHPIGAVADPYHDGIKLVRDIRTKASP